MSEFRAGDIVRVQGGAYDKWFAKVDRVFPKMIDLLLVKDNTGVLLSRPCFKTFRLADVELALVERPRI